jgi:hypothetical protein
MNAKDFLRLGVPLGEATRRAEVDNRRPGSAKVRRGQGKPRHFGMTRQYGVNAAL